jgi:hypothetical protein
LLLAVQPKDRHSVLVMLSAIHALHQELDDVT